jgi:predicted nucleic acid-binding protein
MTEMQKKINRYNILHFYEAVSRTSIELVNKFKLSHNLQIPDAIIAAMCIVYEIPLLTYNVKDFKFMPDIKLDSL